MQLLRRWKGAASGSLGVASNAPPEFPRSVESLRQSRHFKKLVSMGTQNDPSVNSGVAMVGEGPHNGWFFVFAFSCDLGCFSSDFVLPIAYHATGLYWLALHGTK